MTVAGTIVLLVLIVAWLTAAATSVRTVSRIWLRHWAERRLVGGESAPTIERPQRLLIAASTDIASTVFALGALLALHDDGRGNVDHLPLVAGQSQGDVPIPSLRIVAHQAASLSCPRRKHLLGDALVHGDGVRPPGHHLAHGASDVLQPGHQAAGDRMVDRDGQQTPGFSEQAFEADLFTDEHEISFV